MSSSIFPRGTSFGIYPEKAESESCRWEVQATQLIKRFRANRRTRQSRMHRFVKLVDAQGPLMRNLSGTALNDETARVRGRLLRKVFTDDVVAHAFALIREMASRSLGVSHYDVQLAGGWAMINDMISEMETGEGKTLAATLPACTAALAGIPVHIVTVNQYLAQRDAELMAPLYQALGLSAGTSTEGMESERRRRAYRCDITYCTNKQLAFDYLRDRLEMGQQEGTLSYQLKQLGEDGHHSLFLRGLHFAIVDEADSVLIDESRTPLIIANSHVEPEKEAIYRQALALSEQLSENLDYICPNNEREIVLTEQGCGRLRELAEPLRGVWTGQRRREYLVIQALTAVHHFRRDHHYLVADGKVKIIDEYTGRIKADSAWELGLHQMIECKEGCRLTGQNEPLARISFQRFFRRYLKLAGMTGTAREESKELQAVYNVEVMPVPPRLPSKRRVLDMQVYTTSIAKWQAILRHVRAVSDRGRPVLVGTRTVADSEYLSQLFTVEGISHRLLNARQDKQEAEMVAEAGKGGQITIATNMAGRGTDIKLEEGVTELGGLHVVIAECNDASRIDRQLAGRCARQGDPGSVEAILSLEDKIMLDNYPSYLLQLIRHYWRRTDQPLPRWVGECLLAVAQSSVEKHHYRIRQLVFAQDSRINRLLAFTGISE